MLRRIWFFAVLVCLVRATESPVRETASCEESATALSFASTHFTTKQNAMFFNDSSTANIPFIDVKTVPSQDHQFINSTTVPNFQSFEEWKKNKLNQGRADMANNSDSKSNAEKIPPNSSKSNTSNKGENILHSDIGNVKVNKDIRHIQKDEIHQRIKTREGDIQNPNTVNAPLGEEMVIEISMFAGSGEEQGKLYKDRFNYASFDCAATIVKTNKEAKGANAILLDNKDSYLLNECSASSKFIIIELCEDILVDEVLIGNFEFYSSMFKDIKISVSDRFPTTQWIVLGEFQAENVRQLQTFGIENPLIWAKFIKIEFLTHYGNEFYCPISSVQVHGTTMIEQFKEENPDNKDKSDSDTLLPIDESNNEAQIVNPEKEFPIRSPVTEANHSAENGISDLVPEFDVYLAKEKFKACLDFKLLEPEVNCTSKYLKLDQFLVDYEKTQHENFDQCLVEQETEVPGAEEQQRIIETHSHTISSKVQPQDSIYKNIVKRLSLLESNTTLSLLYIEEQSRLLSEAFTNLESQQSIKFQNILSQLNSTIQSQMDIFQKLNMDVYTSFSRLFEYQQQNFDSKTIEISQQISQVSGMISFYRNLTYFCLFVIILLFLYILLTKDLYIDETYFAETSAPISPLFSPDNSPSISPAASIHNIKDLTTPTSTSKDVSEQLFEDRHFADDQGIDQLRRSSLTSSTTVSIESVSASDSSNGPSTTSMKIGNTGFSPPVLYRRRSTLLNSFSKSWSLSPKKAEKFGFLKKGSSWNLNQDHVTTVTGVEERSSPLSETIPLVVPKNGNCISLRDKLSGKVNEAEESEEQELEEEEEATVSVLLPEETGERDESADFEYVYEEEEEEEGGQEEEEGPGRPNRGIGE